MLSLAHMLLPQPGGLRYAQPILHFVTTGLNPVVHAALSATWIAESSPAMTS
jgi:hypothetical protein